MRTKQLVIILRFFALFFVILVFLSYELLSRKTFLTAFFSKPSPRQTTRIAIVSLYSGSSSKYIPLTQLNKQHYANRHGYTFYDASNDQDIQQYLSSEGDVMFLKFFLIQKLLPKFDYVMWSDSDSIFLNHGMSLFDAGIADPDFDVMLTVGHPADDHWGGIVNMGHFLVRSTPWSKEFMQRLWQMRPSVARKCPDDPFGLFNQWLKMCSDSNGRVDYWLNDQGAIMSLLYSSRLMTDFQCHVKYAMMRDMNSEFPWYDHGDLVVHFPGRNFENRKELISAFLEHSNFNTGKVNMIPLIKNDLHDWRVKKNAWMELRMYGWNIKCSELAPPSPLPPAA